MKTTEPKLVSFKIKRPRKGPLKGMLVEARKWKHPDGHIEEVKSISGAVAMDARAGMLIKSE